MSQMNWPSASRSRSAPSCVQLRRSRRGVAGLPVPLQGTPHGQVSGQEDVRIALGAKGATTALIMLLIVLLANGLLQNLVQPFAMGSALELNPLVVLVTTIAAGCLFGTIGLILAAPILSAAVHIPGEIRRLDAWNAPDP